MFKVLHKKSFKHGNLYATPIEGQQSFSLHSIKGSADVQAAVIEFCRNLVHQDVKSFGASRIETPGKEETHDSFVQGLWGRTPGVVLLALYLGSHQTEHVESEDELCLQQ